MNKIRCLFPLEPKEAKALHTRFFPVESMVCVCQYFGLLLKADGHVELIGQLDDKAENWKPFRAEDWTDVVKLYKSDKHIAGLKKDGTVTACGCNDKQQCETGDWRNIREIYISEDATIGIDRNGTARYTYAFQTVSTPTPPPAPAQGIPSPVMPATAVPSPAPAKPPVQNTNSAVGHTTAPAEKKAPSPKTDTPADPSYPKATSSIWFQHRKNANGNITITKYIGPEKNVVIPCAIKGKAVTHIGARAFKGCTLLNTVVIPDSVIKIGANAFDGCTGLTSVILSKGVKDTGDFAFYGCTSLLSVTIPDGVTAIGPYAFKQCRSMLSVTLPDSVTQIGDSAFEKCAKLVSVVIPKSVTHIGNFAFNGCTNLTVYGSYFSYADKYAEEQRIPFSRLC